MHPSISRLPADLFYAGRLLDGISAADRPLPPGFEWPNAQMPVAMLPVERGAGEVRQGTSFANHAEADTRQNNLEAMVDATKLRVWFKARRAIEVGEELCFCYK